MGACLDWVFINNCTNVKLGNVGLREKPKIVPTVLTTNVKNFLTFLKMCQMQKELSKRYTDNYQVKATILLVCMLKSSIQC